MSPMDQVTPEAPPIEAPAAAPAPANADPFVLDESRVASLSPEQRAALEPVMEEWKTRAKAELEKSSKTYEEKYKPQVQKAEALEQLVKDPRFQQWWQAIQKQSVQANPSGAGAVANARPTDFASEAEWQEAWGNAYNGDYSKFQEIQQRMFSVMATPVVQQLQQGQEELKTTLEMKDLFERHTDARELDQIGRDVNDPKSESLLEMCLNWADENGKSLEEGYAKAKAWSDALKVGAKQEALGLVKDKKESTTSGPTTSVGGPAVQEVADADELMQKNMEYLASGQKPPKFVIRTSSPKESRWSQRT